MTFLMFAEMPYQGAINVINGARSLMNPSTD